MQIVVFKSGKNRSSSYKLNGYLFIFILASMVIFASFLFSSATFFYGYKKGYSELNEDRIQDIQRYQYEIKLIKEENKAKMEFFNQKLIGISSQIQTLNSLGKKISNIAKLDKNDFS